MNPASIGSRFIFSVVANSTRALVSLLTGLMVARGLNPHGYGDLTYLISSFVAIRALLDLGSSNAFFTFISQRRRGTWFYSAYFGWLALQLILSSGLIALVLPSQILERLNGRFVAAPKQKLLRFVTLPFV